MTLHANRPAVDDFGNRVSWRVAAGAPLEMSADEANTLLDALLDRWEVATSTYGGDSLADCVEV